MAWLKQNWINIKTCIVNIGPKRAIISLFIIQAVLVVFVSGFYWIILIAIITNTLIYAYGLFLVGKGDYASLRFFFVVLIIISVINMFLKLL